MKEYDDLVNEIAELKSILRDELKLKDLIISQLKEIKKKYGIPRKTEIVEKSEIKEEKHEDIFFENYNCRLVLTKGGYFKKLSVQATRSAEDHKLKEGDYIIYEEDTDNKGDILFVTDKCHIYRARVCDFDLSKPSQMGEYIPTFLGMEENEHVVSCKMIYDLVPNHNMVYIFENGKGVKIPMSAYDAKTKRKKITGAYSSASPLVAAFYESDKPIKIFIRSDSGRGLLFSSDQLETKTTRTAAGNQILVFSKKKGKIDLATDRLSTLGVDVSKFKKQIPSTGCILNQLMFNI